MLKTAVPLSGTAILEWCGGSAIDRVVPVHDESRPVLHVGQRISGLDIHVPHQLAGADLQDMVATVEIIPSPLMSGAPVGPDGRLRRPGEVADQLVGVPAGRDRPVMGGRPYRQRSGL